MAPVVEEIEKAVSELPQVQLTKFRSWYENFDSAAWDEQIEEDASSGTLDAFAQKALIDHREGRTTRL